MIDTIALSVLSTCLATPPSLSPSYIASSTNPISSLILPINDGATVTTFIPEIDENTKAFNKVEAEINEYFHLEDDWDGYGGTAPQAEVIQTSRNFLALIKERNYPAPQTMLSGQGEVGLYWDKSAGYLEIGFDEPNSFSFYIEKDGLEFGEDDLPLVNKNSIPGKILKQLMLFRNA